MANPLVSLCITCYNQSRYIREAVRSAFDQTYEPLEIVICDDHSTDGTDRIIAEMVDAYRAGGGRHSVVFKRNETNLYVYKNYEQAFSLAHGELLITGAGDDISLPNRAERIVEEWERSGRTASCILHAWTSIDEDGRPIGSEGPWPLRDVLGAAAAYSNVIVKNFDALDAECGLYEDDIFTARALLFGQLQKVHEPMMMYRRGVGLSTGGGFWKRRLRVAHSVVRSSEISLEETEARRRSVPQERYDSVKQVIEERLRRYEPEIELFSGHFMFTRLRALMRLRPYVPRRSYLLNYAPAVLPFGIGAVITRSYALLGQLRRKIRKGGGR